MTTIKGIDVYHGDGRIDWKRAAADGVEFAWIKATEGASFVDSLYHVNRDGARAAGVKTAAYHFARPGQSSAQQQLDHFLSVAGIPDPVADLSHGLDLEATNLGPVATTDFAVGFQIGLDHETSRRSVLYTGRGFIDAHLANPERLLPWPLWFAEYPKGTPDPARANRMARPWPHYTVWQYSSSGHEPGTAHVLDMNRAEMTIAELLAVTGARTTAAPADGRFVQTMLNIVRAHTPGHPVLIRIDGDLRSNQSVAAIKEFQRNANGLGRHLEVNGLADPPTCAAIGDFVHLVLGR